MKRKAGSGFYQFDPTPAGKKRRLLAARNKQAEIRAAGVAYNPVYPQIQSKQYVARTPGGNVVADNHYFDGELAQQATLALASSWQGSELDATSGGAPMTCLFAPTEGNDISNRTGRKVFVKKIRVTGALIIPAQTAQSTLDIPARFRLILYCDKQTNATQAQGEQVIESGTAINAISMFQNPDNFGRFKIYKDKTFVLNQNGEVAATDAGTTIVQGGVVRPFKMVATPNCWVNFNNTNGGTVADIVDNSFHLIGNCDNASAGVLISYKVRTTFTP